MPHECRPCRLQRTRTAHRLVPPVHSPDARCTPPPAQRLCPAASPPRVCVLSQSRPRDDPGVSRPRGLRAGGRQTAPP
eukprot:5081801-Prymnesium_polylepis.1